MEGKTLHMKQCMIGPTTPVYHRLDFGSYAVGGGEDDNFRNPVPGPKTCTSHVR
jgi:hypothetical protein